MLYFHLLLWLLPRSHCILNLTLWKPTEFTLLKLPQRIPSALKGNSRSRTSDMVQQYISPNDYLEKLGRQSQKLASENEKYDWKSNNYWFD